MRLYAVCIWCCFTGVVLAQSGTCEPVESTSILAKDLSRVVQAFSAVAPDTVLANAPLPGTRRILRSAEIAQLARKYAVPVETASDVCFAWPMETLDRARVIEAMRRSLNLPDANIKIVETSVYQVPHGEVSFALERLGVPAMPDRASPTLWRGDVIYGGGRRFSVWAKVEITARVTRTIATVALKSGEPIRADQLRPETSESFPLSRNSLPAESVVGRFPIRVIPAGSEIRSADLSAPKAVNAGDSINIEFHSGRTRLTFTGIALSPGSPGDTISVRNPESKKVFRAQVTGTGNAVVQPSSNRAN